MWFSLTCSYFQFQSCLNLLYAASTCICIYTVYRCPVAYPGGCSGCWSTPISSSLGNATVSCWFRRQIILCMHCILTIMTLIRIRYKYIVLHMYSQRQTFIFQLYYNNRHTLFPFILYVMTFSIQFYAPDGVISPKICR